MPDIITKKVSFDFHDTLLVFLLGGKLTRIKFFRTIFYWLTNFRLSVYIYTFLCHPNQPIVDLMRKYKKQGKEVIILTSTHSKNAKIVKHFLNKHKILNYDKIYLRSDMFQSEVDYKVQGVITHNIDLHYDDNQNVCDAINQIGNKSGVVVGR